MKSLKIVILPTFSWILFINLLIANVHAQQSIDVKVDEMVNAMTKTSSAEIAKVSADHVYISIGANQGISSGNLFEVVELGDAIEINGEIIGHDETYVGVLEAVKVRDKLTIANVVDKASELKQGQVVYKKSLPLKRLIVAQFDDGGQTNQFTRIIQDHTINTLVNNGFSVVERDQLEKLLDEQKLGYSGLLDTSSAKKIGELLGADGIILGTVNDTTNNVNINARMVSVASGETLSAQLINFLKTPEIDAMLSNHVSDLSNNKSATKTSASMKNNDSTSKKISEEIEGFQFELNECLQANDKIKCDLNVKSLKGDRDLEVFFNNYGKPTTNIIDVKGKIFNASRAIFADCNVYYNKQGKCEGHLIEGVSTNLQIEFDEISDISLPLQVFTLRIYFGSGTRSVNFKNFTFK